MKNSVWGHMCAQVYLNHAQSYKSTMKSTISCFALTVLSSLPFTGVVKMDTSLGTVPMEVVVVEVVAVVEVTSSVTAAVEWATWPGSALPRITIKPSNSQS